MVGVGMGGCIVVVNDIGGGGCGLGVVVEGICC